MPEAYVLQHEVAHGVTAENVIQKGFLWALPGPKATDWLFSKMFPSEIFAICDLFFHRKGLFET